MYYGVLEEGISRGPPRRSREYHKERSLNPDENPTRNRGGPLRRGLVQLGETGNSKVYQVLYCTPNCHIFESHHQSCQKRELLGVKLGEKIAHHGKSNTVKKETGDTYNRNSLTTAMQSV